ncbi:MAG TPA: hypothetical protein ENI97_05110 [Gammaproteobacteria bacterium]|nr:hypothetical protein [Gammaproteobacteria bacterium]
MKKLLILALGAALLSLLGCSESTDQKAASTQQSAAPASQQSPAGHPLTPAQQAALDAAKGKPKQGVVKQMLHASGYTYMQVDTGDGKPVWIAATMLRVKPEQKVQWTDAAMMRNFTSKTLHRTFEEILFVSNASVVQ